MNREQAETINYVAKEVNKLGPESKDSKRPIPSTAIRLSSIHAEASAVWDSVVRDTTHKGINHRLTVPLKVTREGIEVEVTLLPRPVFQAEERLARLVLLALSLAEDLHFDLGNTIKAILEKEPRYASKEELDAAFKSWTLGAPINQTTSC